jgi:CRISPR-associated protein Cas5d
MLYDVFDLSRESLKDGERPFISLFDATLVAGVLEIPPFDSDAVKKPGGI